MEVKLDVILIDQDKDEMVTVVPSYLKTNKNMTHFYILPFVVYLALLFSFSSQIGLIAQNTFEDVSFPFSSWIFYATIAACAPMFLAVTHLLPDPSISLAIGGFLTSAGLLWTGLETGPIQMVSYCVIAGAGISLCLQAINVALSSYFTRENIAASVGTLLLSAFVMIVLYIIMEHRRVESSSIFLYICPAVLVNSLVPFMIYLYSLSGQSEFKEGKLPYNQSGLTASENLMSSGGADESCHSGKPASDNKQLITHNGWASALLSAIVWLTWGAGIDTTWLSLGWNFHYFRTSTGLASLQLILSFVLLFVKICTELSQSNSSLYRFNCSSNYMQMGILGTAGLSLCLFPKYANAFHNYLLFAAGFTSQYDNLSDIYLGHMSTTLDSAFKGKLVAHRIGLDEINYSKNSISCTICCLICHMLSTLIISVLAMILGVHIASALGFLSSLSPLSFLCSRIGLLILSVAAICISLMRPSFWMKINTED